MTKDKREANMGKGEELNNVVLSEDTENLKMLLKEKVISTQDKNLQLRAAAMAGKLESLKVLLHFGADMLKSTAVHAAAGYGKYECLRFLCEQGADVNKVDFCGLSSKVQALHMCEIPNDVYYLPRCVTGQLLCMPLWSWVLEGKSLHLPIESSNKNP